MRDVKSVTSTFYDNHKHPEIRNNISAASNEDITVVNEWVMTRERARKKEREEEEEEDGMGARFSL